MRKIAIVLIALIFLLSGCLKYDCNQKIEGDIEVKVIMVNGDKFSFFAEPKKLVEHINTCPVISFHETPKQPSLAVFTKHIIRVERVKKK